MHSAHRLQVSHEKSNLYVTHFKKSLHLPMIYSVSIYFKATENSELIEHLCNGVKGGQKFPPSVRLFGLSLYYCSPRAYKFVRKVFTKMPRPKTIKDWISNSDACSMPGVQQSSLDKLKRISQQFQTSSNKKLMCSLVFDEMYIRKQVDFNWYHAEFAGFPNFGNDPNDEEYRMASQALVFMLNGVNASFEFPIAYYFVNSLKASQKQDLLLNIIHGVTQSGVKITNVTFDGHASNISLCKLLGANLDAESSTFQTFFLNPTTQEKIFIIVDPCHAEKLARNILAGKSEIFEPNGKIEWRYIERLYDYSKQNTLRTHKITKKHVQWDRCKMNVRIACQTLSSSVANSLQFLLDQNHPDMEGVEPTIR